ncbi:MAG: site-2 protease family protein [Acidobacteriota bacterium]
MNIGLIIVQLIAFAFALSFHEMAHAWAADRLGDPTARLQGRLSMNPIVHIDPMMTVLFPALLIFAGSPVVFGAAKPVPVNTMNLEHPKQDHMWIAAAGPISNFIQAAATIVLLRLMGVPLLVAAQTGSSWAMPVFSLLQQLLVVNLVLGIFNLIPLYPLDGSWILSRFLTGSAAMAYASLRPYGFLILILLLWVGALDVLLGPVLAIANMLLTI